MTEQLGDDHIIVGKVSAVHGVRGGLKVFSWTQPRENIAVYNPLWLEQKAGQWQAIKVLQLKPQGRSLVAKFEGLDDRDQAAALIGKRLAIKPEQLPVLDDGWYWSQLIGLEVLNTEGLSLGKVAAMQETGANDVIVIGQGEQEVLIPFVTGPVVKQVDLDAGTILVDWDPEYL